MQVELPGWSEQSEVPTGRGALGSAPEMKKTSVKPEHLFMLCEWNSWEGLSEAWSQRKEGPGVHPQKYKQTRLQMVQSEFFWSFICEQFFFLESGATPVFRHKSLYLDIHLLFSLHCPKSSCINAYISMFIILFSTRCPSS